MNARKAKEQRAAERAKLRANLESMRGATPQLVGTDGGQDYYSVGRVLLVVPVLRDDYPPPIKVAIDRRRRAALLGSCDCQATYRITRRVQLALEHEDDCPASDHNLTALAEQHGLSFQIQETQ